MEIKFNLGEGKFSDSIKYEGGTKIECLIRGLYFADSNNDGNVLQ